MCVGLFPVLYPCSLALNDLGEQGSAAVAEALRTNVSLKELK